MRRDLRFNLALGLALGTCGAGSAQTLPAPPPAPRLALRGQQTVRPLLGRFNTVPVLHSNQPEAVNGPGILIDTRSGNVTAETGVVLANPTFRFEGPFGLHFHHLYGPANPGPGPEGRRPELSIAALVINPGAVPVRLRLLRGAVRNSFAAPYRGQQLLGVKPLGPRPWNTGPGDATAVQMLRGRLDANLPGEITIAPGSSRVLVRTDLPALGMVNGLLRGESDGPFHLAMVAAPAPASDEALFAILASRQLAPGRTYLNQLAAIQQGLVFSRVSGVAVGDAYQASLSHDLMGQGPLHVPLTSTVRQTFQTGDVQVNRLAARMPDSALDNVGTYGVRYDVDLLLRGAGTYALVLSHPQEPGSPSPIAFRGSLEVKRPEGVEALHVGLRSGESLTLTTLQLSAGEPLPLQLSFVQPADAIPGHLLSIVPILQLPPTAPGAEPRAPNPPGRGTPVRSASAAAPQPRRTASAPRSQIVAPPVLRPSPHQPLTLPTSLSDRYRQALEAQERLMRSWQTP